ncbi:MAG: TolC family protein [Planctomycetes bacterium]|nr:TolC family protein [Planctomycetota bacterium]
MRRLLCASVLVVLSGCHVYTLDVDGRVAQRASQAVDVAPAAPERLPTLPDKAPKARFGAPIVEGQLVPVEFQKEPDKGKKSDGELIKRLTEHTKRLPGGDVEGYTVKPDATPAEREAAIKKHFPPLSKIAPLPTPLPGPDGRPLTLAELQQTALANNPVVRQAHLDVEAARGLARQAGAYPNPSIGYEAATINQGNNDGKRSPGQQGGFFEQTLITMGKLTLAREAALRDVMMNEQKLRQVESDLQSQVRNNYFAVLSAQKNYETIKAVTDLTDELYHVLLAQLKVGEVAAYEPRQIRVLSNKARNAMTQAQNRYQTAWKQLAASLGTPAMPLTALSGQIDMPVPHFEHDQVLAHVLNQHSDVQSAQLGVEKARLLLRLAEVQPYPDVTVHVAFQKDYTSPPFGTVANVSVGLPFPLWHRNQGSIQSAGAMLRRSVDDNQRVRNELTSRVAEAFERYANNREILERYRKEILPDQVQAYRHAAARHALFAKQDIPYNDVVTSQQTLADLITSYLGALNDQWTAAVDIANLLQTKDLFQTQPLDEVAPVPDVHEILRGGLLRHRR